MKNVHICSHVHTLDATGRTPAGENRETVTERDKERMGPDMLKQMLQCDLCGHTDPEDGTNLFVDVGIIPPQWVELERQDGCRHICNACCAELRERLAVTSEPRAGEMPGGPYAYPRTPSSADLIRLGQWLYRCSLAMDAGCSLATALEDSLQLHDIGAVVALERDIVALVNALYICPPF